MYAATADRVDAQVRASRGVARMAAARSLAIAVGGWLPIPLLLAAAPWMLHRGATAGQIIGALAYVAGGLQAALHTLVQGVGGSGVRVAVTLERIMERGAPARGQAAEYDTSPGADSPADPTNRTAGPPDRTAGPPDRTAECEIDLRGLTFGYGPQAIPVIRDLSLFIPDGDHLTIVGPSGIGKSTLTGLLAGTLTPCAGEVRLGGVPLHDLGTAALTSRRVLIPQEAYVFAGTLTENLCYLNPHASHADVDTAADLLGLRPLVTRVGGYAAQLEPALLSAGERQLIALGRAYLSPARLAVLDEATCHLDPAAEARAERAFADRPGTLIVVAHRMSSALRWTATALTWATTRRCSRGRRCTATWPATGRQPQARSSASGARLTDWPLVCTPECRHRPVFRGPEQHFGVQRRRGGPRRARLAGSSAQRASSRSSAARSPGAEVTMASSLALRPGSGGERRGRGTEHDDLGGSGWMADECGSGVPWET